MRKLLKGVVVLFIIGLGVGVYLLLVSTRTEPRRHGGEEHPVLVEVTRAEASTERVRVKAMGTVVPARSVTVYPEAAGRIVYQSSRLVPGGRFRKGEILVRIDPRDYELAVKQQRAKVVQARTELAREKGMKAVAEREWNMIRDEVQPTAEGRKLALREVQLQAAQAALEAAEAALEQAELQQSRTVVRAPFDCVVTDEFVDKGQVVSNASRIATLVASDIFRVQVSLPMDQLGWIRIPGVHAEAGSPAKVVQKAGARMRVERDGRVVKLLGELDPRGKMARLLVEVDDPLGSPGANGSVMPLLLGAYVQVEIQGPQVEGVISLPRRALHGRNRVWIKTGEGKLDIREVDLVWAKTDSVFVRGDIRPDEQIVLSRIAAPVEGMRLITPDDLPVPGGDKTPPRVAPRGEESGDGEKS